MTPDKACTTSCAACKRDANIPRLLYFPHLCRPRCTAAATLALACFEWSICPIFSFACALASLVAGGDISYSQIVWVPVQLRVLHSTKYACSVVQVFAPQRFGKRSVGELHSDTTAADPSTRGVDAVGVPAASAHTITFPQLPTADSVRTPAHKPHLATATQRAMLVRVCGQEWAVLRGAGNTPSRMPSTCCAATQQKKAASTD